MGNLIETVHPKIDNEAVDGLGGVADSLAYKVNEIERHHHNDEKIFGLAGTPSGETHVADRITLLPEPFQADAGNNTWGSWLQVMGSSDSPIVGGGAYYDFHEILIVGHEHNTTPYFIQIAGGESAGLAAKISSEDFTETSVITGAGSSETGPILVKSRRAAAGVKCWVRIWAKGQNTGTLDFYK
jgi:hypothetical protein